LQQCARPLSLDPIRQPGQRHLFRQSDCRAELQQGRHLDPDQGQVPERGHPAS